MRCLSACNLVIIFKMKSFQLSNIAVNVYSIWCLVAQYIAISQWLYVYLNGVVHELNVYWTQKPASSFLCGVCMVFQCKWVYSTVTNTRLIGDSESLLSFECECLSCNELETCPTCLLSLPIVSLDQVQHRNPAQDRQNHVEDGWVKV